MKGLWREKRLPLKGVEQDFSLGKTLPKNANSLF